MQARQAQTKRFDLFVVVAIVVKGYGTMNAQVPEPAFSAIINGDAMGNLGMKARDLV